MGKRENHLAKIFVEKVGDLEDDPVLLSGMFATLNIDL